jgi:chromosomal replication initiation ATPase DnaA
MIAIPVIAARVAEYYQVPLASLVRSSVSKPGTDKQVPTVARGIAMVIASRQGWGPTAIGDYFNVHHSTALAAIKSTTDKARTYPQTEQLIEQLSA